MKKEKLLISILLNIVFLVIISLIFGFRYENPDDIYISRFIMQGYICPHSYQWLSYFCHSFSNIIKIPIWSLLTIILISFCNIIVLNDVLKNTKNKQLKYILISILFLINIDLLFQCQYTKTASFIASVGIINIGKFFKCKEIKSLILGLILFFIGISIRHETLTLLIPFLVLSLIINCKNKNKLMKNSLICFSIILIFFIFNQINNITYKEQHNEYINYNSIRTKVIDYQISGFEKINELQTISENDFNSLKKWIIADTEYFNTNKLNTISQEMINIAKVDIKLFIQNTIKNLMSIIFHPLGIILLLFSLYLFKKTNNKKYLLFPLGLLALTLLFSFLNRFPYRIQFSTLVAFILLLFYEIQNIDNFNCKKQFIVLITTCIFLTTCINIAFPTISINSNLPLMIKSVNEEIYENPENKYYVSNSINFVEFLNYKMFDTEIQTEPNNTFYHSWQTESEYFKDKLNKLNISNPILDLTRIHNYYAIVSEQDENIDLIKTYLEENYKIKTEIVTIKDLIGAKVIQYKIKQ